MERSAFILKAFLSQCPPERTASLERFLPESQKKVLSGLPTYDLIPHLCPDSLLDQVHWSWFLPTLKTHAEQDQKYFLSSFSTSAAESLGAELQLSFSKDEISKVGKKYLQQILIHSLVGFDEKLLPQEYLPPSPLNQLLVLSKKELTRFISLLSIHDLGLEMRQIVETKILKKIYSFLNDDEKHFLKTVMTQKEPYSWPKMGLDKWEGTEEAFKHLLHKRGLNRLATALSGQDPDLIWHVCHQLDIGRGSALFKLCGKEPLAGISDWVIRQIEELFAKRELKS